MDPLKFPIKNATSDTSTIIISRGEFADRAAKAIAKSDIIKAAPIEIAMSIINLSALIVYEVEKELFGEGGEEK
jgi:hypothetical protein